MPDNSNKPWIGSVFTHFAVQNRKHRIDMAGLIFAVWSKSNPCVFFIGEITAGRQFSFPTLGTDFHTSSKYRNA
jgi:hypothetical protein